MWTMCLYKVLQLSSPGKLGATLLANNSQQLLHPFAGS